MKQTRKKSRTRTRAGKQGHHRRPDLPTPASHEADRLTADEKKRLFARNLDRLLGLVGLGRKSAADEIGIDYKLLRRFVSEGISKMVKPNAESLTRIAGYFAVPNVADLWASDLLPRLLSTEEGHSFVEKFRSRLVAERERRLAEERAERHDELALLSRAMGYESGVQSFTEPWADKVRTILASPKGQQFKRIIDDYHQLALVTGALEDR